MPDFTGIRNYLKMALSYAISADMRQAAFNRLNTIDMMIYLYKADVAASKGTLKDFKKALEFMDKAAALDLDAAQSDLVRKKIESIKELMAALQDKTSGPQSTAMYIKRILILAPAILIIVLLQSYFWVPTYDQQTRGNPERLTTYIAASIGDASVLNPILSADTASSTIESLVFEGLIDRDEELRFRGRLARSWEIYQTAYFYVNESADIPGIGKADPAAVVGLIQTARKHPEGLRPELIESLRSITDIRILPPADFHITKAAKGPDQQTAALAVQIRVRAPSRIQLTLNRVDQHLFQNLRQILGQTYFETFPAQRFLETTPRIPPEKLSAYAEEVLPATEHNPIITFHLRPGVKFHDGHILDAQDVRFTYDAIMDAKNLSPRTSDYESVKAVEVIDP
jgi:hypothetical protein